MAEKYLTESEVRDIVSQCLNNFAETMRVKSGIIQSQNFVAGTSGWIIRADGSVEFSSGTFRGDILIGSSSNSQVSIVNESGSGVIKFYYAGDLKGKMGSLSNGDLYLEASAGRDIYFATPTQQIVRMQGNPDGFGSAGDLNMRKAGSMIYWPSERYLKDSSSAIETNGDFKIPASNGFYVGNSGGSTGTYDPASGHKIEFKGGIAIDLNA